MLTAEAQGIVLGDSLTPCEAYTLLYRVKLRETSAWLYAVLSVGLITAAALIAAIVLAVSGEGVAAITSAVGTVVTGVASGWLWSKRSESYREMVALLRKANEICGPEQRSALDLPGPPA